MFAASPHHTRPGTPSGLREPREPGVQSFEGRTLGAFHIGPEIACGGMGRVFLAHRAHHAGVGQPAAVKVIHPHLAREDEFINMFLDEARIASSLSHPNVCRVLDFGVADGTYYLAMDFVMGESLADVMTGLRRLPDAEWIAEPLMRYVGHQVCEALHAVHEARDIEGAPLDIIHRDVSPQNIMIGYDGSVRLLDFGVACAAERLQATRAGVIKGRLAYMAPEQMRGSEVDRRADLWSVGVILWEGLTGRRLFRRDHEAQTVLAVMNEDILPPTHPARPVPLPIQRVVTRALQRDPARRYGHARELGMDLMRCKGTFPLATMSDVSEWMQGLFATSIAQKRRQLGNAARAAYAARSISEVLAIPYDHDDDDEAETSLAITVPPEMRRSARKLREAASAPRHSTPTESVVAASPARELVIEPRTSGWFGRIASGALLAAAAVVLMGGPQQCSAPGSLVRSAAAAVPMDRRDIVSGASSLLADTKLVVDESLKGMDSTIRTLSTPIVAHASDDGERAPAGSGAALSGPSSSDPGDSIARQAPSTIEAPLVTTILVQPLPHQAEEPPSDEFMESPSMATGQATQGRRPFTSRLVRAKRSGPQLRARGWEPCTGAEVGASEPEG